MATRKTKNTNWNEVADNSAEQTDAELAKGLEKLAQINTAVLFPKSIDKDAVDALISKIKASTSYNDKVAVFKAVSLTLAPEVLKVVKKLMLCLIFCIACLSSSQAQLVSPPQALQPQVKTLDITNPLADPRLGLAYNLKGESMTIAYVPFVYWMPKGKEYITLNFGATNNNATGDKDYLVSIGPRIDILIKQLSEIPSVKRNFSFLQLPPLQVAPSLITTNFKKYTWWLTIASKFGGQ